MGKWNPEPLETKRLKALPPKVQQKLFGKTGNYARYGVNGEGSCFFHSVCAATEPSYLDMSVSEQRSHGQKFRCMLGGDIADDEWGGFVRKHKVRGGTATKKGVDMGKTFCSPSTWADEAMIKYTSEKLGLNILFVNVDGRGMYCGVHGKPGDPTMVILWLDEAHFEPLCRVHRFVRDGGGDKDNKAEVQFLFDAQQDADVVGSVMGTYESQCKV